MPSINQLAKAAGQYDPEKVQAIGKLLNIGLTGLGAGVAGRSLLGLWQMASKPKTSPYISPGPTTLEIPVVRPSKQQQKLAADGPLSQMAGELQGAMGQGFQHLKEHLSTLLPDSFLGWKPSSPARSWAAIPTGVALGAAGLGGGWALTDHLINQHRKRQMDSELDAAKQDYEQALLGQSAPGQKLAADATYAGLDQLYDAIEKQADMSFGDFVNAAPGAYLTAAGALGAGTAYGVYNWTKARSAAAMLRKAQQARARQLWSQSPQSILAIPKYVEQSQQSAA